MSEQAKKRQMIDLLLQDYPDCPQREMALSLVRQGLFDQAHAWADALDDLRHHGQGTLFAYEGGGTRRRA